MNTSGHFYRTAAGAEVDVIMSMGSKRIGFEIEYSAAPKPSRGFWTATEELEVDHAYVVAPIQDRFPLSATVEAISPLDLWDVIASK
jgi:predicted AAA+ superfamily ATPase